MRTTNVGNFLFSDAFETNGPQKMKVRTYVHTWSEYFFWRHHVLLVCHCISGLRFGWSSRCGPGFPRGSTGLKFVLRGRRTSLAALLSVGRGWTKKRVLERSPYIHSLLGDATSMLSWGAVLFLFALLKTESTTTLPTLKFCRIWGFIRERSLPMKAAWEEPEILHLIMGTCSSICFSAIQIDVFCEAMPTGSDTYFYVRHSVACRR